VKPLLLIALVGAALMGAGGLMTLKRDAGTPSVDPDVARPVDRWPDQVVADGVIEGARPEVALRTEVAGLLAAVPARENEDVRRGALVAELQNASQTHQVALAAAEVAVAEAELERLRNGERPEKQKIAAAAEQGKRVLYEQAKTDFTRSQRLLERGSSSPEERDRDRFAMERTRAEWDEAAAERALIEAPARADEVATASARVDSARARLRLAEAELAKTRLLAPFDGRVLRIFAEPGELAGPVLTTPQPILILADLSRRRVRAFVEELDAARVREGQRATVTADGLPGREFPGRVSEVAGRMGKRALQSDAPGEYKDLYFREIVIDLDTYEELPLNLRVRARVDVPSAEEAR
jgi:HlyD family secretion protein